MNEKIVLPIDTKSLYFNIFNDNKTGHTCTVATPIKQGGSTNFELLKVYDIPKKIDFINNIELCDLLNKSSKSVTRIEEVFLFDKISVNGINVECNSNYCFFIKEEIDSKRKQFGRKKLHYPISLKFDGKYSFDNKKVIQSISKILGDYAFIVKSFEYYFDSSTLNFDVDIIGYENIPYSKVFISNKGVGSKYLSNYVDVYENYDYEIIGLKEYFKNYEINPINYFDYYFEAKKYALNIISNHFDESPSFLSLMYPYSLYDFSYYNNEIKKYVLVFFSTSKETYFNISIRQWSFINLFQENVEIYSITKLFKNNNITKYTFNELNSMNKSISGFTIR